MQNGDQSSETMRIIGKQATEADLTRVAPGVVFCFMVWHVITHPDSTSLNQCGHFPLTSHINKVFSQRQLQLIGDFLFFGPFSVKPSLWNLPICHQQHHQIQSHLVHLFAPILMIHFSGSSWPCLNALSCYHLIGVIDYTFCLSSCCTGVPKQPYSW